jgi:hypothetical protein
MSSTYKNSVGLGTDVAFDGNTIAAVDRRGYVYLFESPSSTGAVGWTLRRVFDAPSGASPALSTSATYSLAMNSSKIVLGYSGYTAQGTSSGGVFVFNR